VLLGRHAAYLRASNDAAFTITISGVTITLPTR
jgi:hypothetical protein